MPPAFLLHLHSRVLCVSFLGWYFTQPCYSHRTFLSGWEILSIYLSIYHLSFFKDFIYLFLEREEGRENERERNIHVREKYWLVAFCRYPSWGPNPQPGHMPWLGIEPVTVHFAGRHPTNAATPARATAALKNGHCFLVVHWKWR